MNNDNGALSDTPGAVPLNPVDSSDGPDDDGDQLTVGMVAPRRCN